MADIIYEFMGNPYLNLTNQCPCACTFCLRDEQQGVGSAETLWHERDPGWKELQAALEGYDFSRAGEAVFCGYGEPFCALAYLKQAAAWIKERFPAIKLRVNTNGLGDLINQRGTAGDLAGLVDTISISLNAPDAGRYRELCRPAFGEAAFDSMLHFAKQCKMIYPRVILSVVDVLTPEEIVRCRAIADGMGIPLRVRKRGS